ncbi:hypothetical protein D3C81_1444430 [compost metagenome]
MTIDDIRRRIGREFKTRAHTAGTQAYGIDNQNLAIDGAPVTRRIHHSRLDDVSTISQLAVGHIQVPLSGVVCRHHPSVTAIEADFDTIRVLGDIAQRTVDHDAIIVGDEVIWTSPAVFGDRVDQCRSQRCRRIEDDFLAGGINHFAAGRNHSGLINDRGIVMDGWVLENPSRPGRSRIGPGQATIS